MEKNNRHNQIIQFLSDTEYANIGTLAKHFSVSTMTIRRDLKTLEALKLIRLFYGGAALNKDFEERTKLNDLKYIFQAQHQQKIEEKNRIGKLAASFVSDGDVIIVDSGTTTEIFVRSIPASLSITVVCYTFNILDIVRQRSNWQLVLVGGQYHPSTMMFESEEGLNLIENIRANKAFIAAGGISETLGITCINRYETPTKKAAIRSSAERFLLADSSKFGKVVQSYYAELDEFHTIITDNMLSQEYKEILTGKNINLILA
ncbi:MAG: DeoR/GlpR family DNA-binding transcription regulator [Spirochaetaceae bacterium]|jgi:DeoR family deoxyribose operon repressor|nr:DeoR/GlpR family DNA-binding transcription regulator [Spirochaetaceae bacterium]